MQSASQMTRELPQLNCGASWIAARRDGQRIDAPWVKERLSTGSRLGRCRPLGPKESQHLGDSRPQADDETLRLQEFLQSIDRVVRETLDSHGLRNLTQLVIFAAYGLNQVE
jgi:hypothetical protein